MSTLSKDELIRYGRQIMLPNFGEENQLKLKGAKVLVIGAGGLGCPALQYLCASGIGKIGIMDFDTVELHNLNRQILFVNSDIGKPKAETAAEKLSTLNPAITFSALNEAFNKKNAEIVDQFDIVIDGTDNFPTRYFINDTCSKYQKPLVFGSIYNFEGQLAVFDHKKGKSLRAIFPEPPDPEHTPGCNENGVLGTVPGILGAYMANSCIQVLLGRYEDYDSYFIFDFEKLSILKLRY